MSVGSLAVVLDEDDELELRIVQKRENVFYQSEKIELLVRDYNGLALLGEKQIFVG